MFVHNHDADKLGDLDSKRLQSEWFWNIWRKRLRPYDQLAAESRVALLVSSRNGSSIRFVVRPDRVLATPFRTQSEAIGIIAKHIGQKRSFVANEPYTASRGEGPGFLLVWRAADVKRIDAPRPAALELRRHGWGEVTDSRTLRRWGVGPAGAAQGQPAPVAAAKSTHGQGWQTDTALRLAVEARAMLVAREWMKANGFSDIRDVSKTKSWDFEARRGAGGVTRRIEVKGISGTGLSFFATPNELEAAKAGKTLLLVVNGITTSKAAGAPSATGGRLHILDPWLPQESELEVQQYRWSPKAKNKPRPA